LKLISPRKRIISIVLSLAMFLPGLIASAEAAVVTWLSPQPGERITARNVEVSVGFNTQSDKKVTRVELWVDGHYHAHKFFIKPDTRGVASLVWNTNGFGTGRHDLVVKVYSGDELLSKVAGSGSVDVGRCNLRAPVVTFSNVKSGDVLKGITLIKMNASDDSGEPPLVSLLVDKSLKLIRNTPPYNYSLDTTTYCDGSHELETYAYDSDGNKSDPAVVKVSFRNGQRAPVVASMSVNPVPASKTVDALGELAPITALPVEKTSASAAARSSGAQVSDATVTSPLASAAKPVSASPKRAIPPSEAKLVPVVRDVTQSTIPINHAASTNTPRATEPAVTEPARVSTPAYAAVSGNFAAVEVKSGPRTMPSRVIVPKTVPLTTAAASATTQTWSTASESCVCDARVTTATRPFLKAAKSLIAAPKALMPQAKILAPAAENLPVKMALAPRIDMNTRLCTVAGRVGCRKPVRVDAIARLEKIVLPTSGRVKLRDLVAQLGGVVFWDTETRTVTAYAGNLKFEFTIGKNEVKVNGRVVRVDVVPELVNGRTIIDVGMLRQVCQLVKTSVPA